MWMDVFVYKVYWRNMSALMKGSKQEYYTVPDYRQDKIPSPMKENKFISYLIIEACD